MSSQKLPNQGKRNESSTTDGKSSKLNAGRFNSTNDINETNTDELPPPPLPRKPQIQDPLGATNHSQTKPDSNPIRYQNLDTKELDSRNHFHGSSTGDSSPPSSLSAESTNSDETKSLQNSNKYLGAIPKRKTQPTTIGQDEQLHGMAKHMKRNKTTR